jgi:hypothetical protein
MRLAALFEDSMTNTEIAEKLGIDVYEVNKLKPKELKIILKDIGKHDFVPLEKFNKKEYQMGLKVEQEHADNLVIAALIVRDHLMELPDYYTRLKKMENE